MKIIITGGTGLLGEKLVDALLEKNHDVIVLSRNPHKAKQLPGGAKLVQWDSQSAAGWVKYADGADVIINLAGENLAGEGFFPKRWDHERRQRIVRSRLQAGQAVVAAVEQAKQKPKAVIQASAIGYYGPQDNRLLDEASPPGNDFLAETCVQWESATAGVTALGVRQIVTRIGVVLTPEGGALQRLLLPFKFFVGGPFGDGQQWYSWIHVDDVIRALVFLAESSTASGIYNLTAPNPVTNANFSKALGEVLQRPSWLPVPGFAMRLAFGEVSTVVLDGQRVLPKRLLADGFEFMFSDVKPAFRDLLP